MNTNLEYEGKTYDELIFIYQNLDTEIRTLVRKRKVIEDLLLKHKQERRGESESIFKKWETTL